MTIIAAADGSALKNPGPTGWAWAIDESTWRSGGFAYGTNNIGELYAVFDLLKATAHLDEPLHIVADSQYVINTFTKWIFGWKRKGWKKSDGSAVLNVELIQQIDELLQGREVTWEWVKGHSGHPLNEFVDRRARSMAVAYRDGLPGDTGPGIDPPKARAFNPQERPDAVTYYFDSSGEGHLLSEGTSLRENVSSPEGTSLPFPSHPAKSSPFFGEPTLTPPMPTGIPENKGKSGALENEENPESKSLQGTKGLSVVPDLQDECDLFSFSASIYRHGTSLPFQGQREDASQTTPAIDFDLSVGKPAMTTYRVHGFNVADHFIDVPLDHADPNGPLITVFVREICDGELGDLSKPALIYMQGGPGGRGPRPGDYRAGWIGQALKKYRVFLLDQRGTGLSTRLDEGTLSTFKSAQEAVTYLKCFRADSIVRDAELIRESLNGGRKWSSFGQSYGGFINTTYLSLFPDALEAVFFTGGLPGLTSIDEIYARTYRATAERNRVFFKRFEADEHTFREVIHHLQNHEELLPNGEVLSPGRLRMLGLGLGGESGFDQLHYFFEGPFYSVNGQKRLTKQFLDSVYRQVSMGDSPLYALMHETIYAGAVKSTAGQPTAWGAWRLLEQVGSLIPEGFAADPDPRDLSTPIYLTGEHIYPWLFSEDLALRPLKEIADLLAQETDWPVLYDEDVLASCAVPAAAAVYFEDMFVPTDLSLRTAELARVRPWVTNEFQHDGLRVDGARIFERLSDLAFE